jgi:hypothetical protein
LLDCLLFGIDFVARKSQAVFKDRSRAFLLKIFHAMAEARAFRGIERNQDFPWKSFASKKVKIGIGKGSPPSRIAHKNDIVALWRPSSSRVRAEFRFHFDLGDIAAGIIAIRILFL